MKFGIRKFSSKKRFISRTTGALKRKYLRAIIPYYGKKGMGIFHPKKMVYNKVYDKTSFDILKFIKKNFH